MAHTIASRASSIAVRELAYCAECIRFETHFEQRVGHSLIVHPLVNGDVMKILGR